jgi:two-component system, response regulator PdtaR
MPKKRTSYSKQIEALSKISKAISSDLYLDDILKMIVTVTAEVMNSKICSLMLLDDRNELAIKATQSISEEYTRKPPVKLGQGIAGIVAKTNKHIVVADVREDNRYINRDIAKKEGLCSLLSIPLGVKGKVIGVLNLYTDIPHKFTQNEIETLTTVASQAAVVIENSRLIIHTKVIQEELETRKLVERAKGILMRDGITEDEAYRKIQKKSMDLRKPMKEIAEAIILSSEIKK